MQVQMLCAPFVIPNSPLTKSPYMFLFPSYSRPTSLLLVLRQNLSNIAAVHKTLPGPFTIVANILCTSCPRDLWLGHTGTMFCKTGGTAEWFASKEFFALFLHSRRLTSPTLHIPSNQSKSAHRDNVMFSPWESALSGALYASLHSTQRTPSNPPSKLPKSFTHLWLSSLRNRSQCIWSQHQHFGVQQGQCITHRGRGVYMLGVGWQWQGLPLVVE